MYSKTRYTQQDRSLLRGWAELIDKIDWSAFCTFTYYHKMSAKSARRKMDGLLNLLTEKYGPSTQIFWVAEPFKDLNSFHVHALIKINESALLLKNVILHAWHSVAKPGGHKKHNLTSIEPYEPGRGAHYYVAKHLQNKRVDYDLLFI